LHSWRPLRCRRCPLSSILSGIERRRRSDYLSTYETALTKAEHKEELLARGGGRDRRRRRESQENAAAEVKEAEKNRQQRRQAASQ
jgi:hypothetical protein